MDIAYEKYETTYEVHVMIIMIITTLSTVQMLMLIALETYYVCYNQCMMRVIFKMTIENNYTTNCATYLNMLNEVEAMVLLQIITLIVHDITEIRTSGKDA
jgi:hypothetical protein